MADRQTRVLGGNGTSVQAFTLDPGLLQYVQSVHVKVDNSGGADIQPTLTVQTNNGVDIAKKQQGRSIPAGDSGSATWALRLDDEATSSGEQISVAHVLFTAAEIAAGATKILVAGVPGVIVVPVDYMVAASDDLEYTTLGPIQPTIDLESPTWPWNSYDVPALALTRFSTFSGFIGENTFDNPSVDRMGEPLQARVYVNDLDGTSVIGQMDVWAAWHRARVTP